NRSQLEKIGKLRNAVIKIGKLCRTTKKCTSMFLDIWEAR
ncbi:12062_t:CDS:1, partial [Gigaspora rosea]